MKKVIKGLVFFIALTAIACSGKKEAEFQIAEVRKMELNNTVTATGIIKPKVGAEINVGSRISGIVRKLYVNTGDTVQKGELLAVLDEAQLSAKFRLENANLENARTLLKYAAIEMERMKQLSDQDYASVQSYDNAVKEYDMAVARVASQQASLDYAETELTYTHIYAPISGVIGSVSTREGETVMAAFVSPTFVSIIDVSRMEVQAFVDETDIGKVHTGQRVAFTVDTYPGISFSGYISAIYPKAEIKDNVVNYIAVIEFERLTDSPLRPEMTAFVTIVTSETGRVICVPNNAINRDLNENIVYVLENGRPGKKKVVTGVRSNDWTEIKQGLNENEKVILNSEVLKNEQ